MRDREVTIRIRGKNLTEAEFKKARQQGEGIGRATDKTSKGVKGLGKNFSSVSKSLGQVNPQLSMLTSGLSQMIGPEKESKEKPKK